jgi:hypothetical protein
MIGYHLLSVRPPPLPSYLALLILPLSLSLPPPRNSSSLTHHIQHIPDGATILRSPIPLYPAGLSSDLPLSSRDSFLRVGARHMKYELC